MVTHEVSERLEAVRDLGVWSLFLFVGLFVKAWNCQKTLLSILPCLPPPEQDGQLLTLSPRRGQETGFVDTETEPRMATWSVGPTAQ